MQRTPSARLLAPRLSLASCVRAYVTRSTIDCALPAHNDRYNRYPATPFCSITWQVHGATALVEHDVACAPNDQRRVDVLEAFLEPRWQQLRRSGEISVNVVADYVRRLGVQAAATGWGRGPRIVERRIRAWAGLPMRTLQRLGRAEQAFFAARDGGAALGHIAAEHRYADQSHMTREAKAITGLSPGELLRSIDHESYWIYRIWS